MDEQIDATDAEIHCILSCLSIMGMMNGIRAVCLSTDHSGAFLMKFSLQMKLIPILIHCEIIYMDYLKTTAMKAVLCPSNKGCGSSEVRAGRLMFSQGPASFGVGLFSRLVL